MEKSLLPLMNFKPTTLKTIVSLLLGLLINFTIFMNLGGGCRGIYCYYPGFVNYRFLWVFLTIFIYLIWSLIEKKIGKDGS